MKYEIRDKAFNKIEVEGETIKLRGYSEFEFISHACIEENFGHLISISELLTGALVATGVDLKDVENIAMSNLKKVGPKKFREMIDKIMDDISDSEHDAAYQNSL